MLAVTFWTPADMYGSGRNENSWATRDPRAGGARSCSRRSLATSAGPRVNFSRARRSTPMCAPVLRRQPPAAQGRDHRILYYQHRVDPKVPIEDTGGGDGRPGGGGQGCGISGCRRPRQPRFAAPPRCTRSQRTDGVSLWSRDPSARSTADGTARELGIGFVAYSPLVAGFLTGRFKTFEDSAGRTTTAESSPFQGENFRKIPGPRGEDRGLAQHKDAHGQPARARVGAGAGAGRRAIPGTKQAKFVDANLAAAGVVLSPEDLRAIQPGVLPRLDGRRSLQRAGDGRG